MRGVVDAALTPLESRQYSPYGEPYGTTGSNQTVFGFTGEPTDSNGLVQLRNRYYNPTLGQFFNLDPLEVLNRYQYVAGDPINLIDATGMTATPGPIGECGIPYDLAEESCPSRAGDHPQIVGDLKMDAWRDKLKFCKGGKKNDNLDEIVDEIQNVYAIALPKKTYYGGHTVASINEWSWDSLTSVARGVWLTARALEVHAAVVSYAAIFSKSGEDIFSKAFKGAQMYPNADQGQSILMVR